MSDGGISWLTARPIAHRGLHDGNRRCWENTLSAFERAVSGNFSIECDVVLTTDCVPMVFHDRELTRLTGRRGKVCETSADELSRMVVGTSADRPPSLAETLALVACRVPVVIELKGNEDHDAGFVAAVAEALRNYKGKAAIMSFSPHLVRRFATQAPGVPAGLTAEGTSREAMEAHFSMLAHGISFVSYAAREIPNPFVAFTRDRLGLPFITWTVRDRRAAGRTWAQGGQITFEGFDPDRP